VGKQDIKPVTGTLVKHALAEAEIIAKSLKQEGKESYKQQLQIHNALTDNRRAIKLCILARSRATMSNSCLSFRQNAKMYIVDYSK
jgi:hypothetical protein